MLALELVFLLRRKSFVVGSPVVRQRRPENNMFITLQTAIAKSIDPQSYLKELYSELRS